jgi:hypothetical protein
MLTSGSSDLEKEGKTMAATTPNNRIITRTGT